MANLRGIVTAALSRQRRRIKKELASAEAQLRVSGGVLWEKTEQKKRELHTIEIMIEEWRKPSAEKEEK